MSLCRIMYSRAISFGRGARPVRCHGISRPKTCPLRRARHASDPRARRARAPPEENTAHGGNSEKRRHDRAPVGANAWSAHPSRRENDRAPVGANAWPAHPSRSRPHQERSHGALARGAAARMLARLPRTSRPHNAFHLRSRRARRHAIDRPFRRPPRADRAPQGSCGSRGRGRSPPRAHVGAPFARLVRSGEPRPRSQWAPTHGSLRQFRCAPLVFRVSTRAPRPFRRAPRAPSIARGLSGSPNARPLA